MTGGVGELICAYISNNIVSRRLDTHKPADIDLIWIELILQTKRVIVGVGYHPPRQPRALAELFMDQFSSSL